MEKFLKNLGLGMILLGAILLVLATLVPAMADMLDENWYTATSLVLVIFGLLAHIILNKYLFEKK